MTAVPDAVSHVRADGTIGRRLWVYSNYHCNLVYTCCLTESGPKVARRELDPETMLDLAREANELGLTGVGITNGTLFSRASLLERMAPLADADVTLQISLDSPEAEVNDVMRGPENFRKVVEAVPELLRRGLPVRIATTLEEEDADDLQRLCALHRDLGVSDDDHVVRPILRHGRAETGGLGVVARYLDLEPELTVTADVRVLVSVRPDHDAGEARHRPAAHPDRATAPAAGRRDARRGGCPTRGGRQHLQHPLSVSTSAPGRVPSLRR